MILLRYAGLLKPDENPPLGGMKLSEKDLATLLFWTKNFVICGYQITAEQAIQLSNDERAAYYQSRNKFLREFVSLIGLATIREEKATEQVFNAEWEFPVTESDRICEYLAKVGMNS